MNVDLSHYFLNGTSYNKDYKNALGIVFFNSENNNVWAIGGLVYRSIINKLYGLDSVNDYDFDFIVEKPRKFEELQKPAEWVLTKTGLGEARFIGGKVQIDLCSIDNAINPAEKSQFDIKNSSNKEKLESYFRRVPLNLQAIAFDFVLKKAIGVVGRNAILNKTIEVNNLTECLSYCRRKRISVHKFLTEKNEPFNFRVIYPNFIDISKTETKDFYETYSEEYTKTRGEAQNSFTSKYLSDEIDQFINCIEGRKKIIDLGSGPGRDALLFKERGLNPVCVDISDAMVKICKDRGLESYQMDIENLSFEDGAFSGVWAYASLIHIPKNRIYNTLARISEILQLGAPFFVGMVEGDGEVLYRSKKHQEKSRLFARYKDAEFRAILNEYFEILTSKRIVTPNNEVYLNYLCKKPL
jgi:SAM-dependent methyltransferase